MTKEGVGAWKGLKKYDVINKHPHSEQSQILRQHIYRVISYFLSIDNDKKYGNSLSISPQSPVFLIYVIIQRGKK